MKPLMLPVGKLLPKLTPTALVLPGYVDRAWIWRSLYPSRLLDFPHQISAGRNIGKSVVALRVGDGVGFARVYTVIAVEVDVNLPVGQRGVCRVSDAVGIEVIVFDPANAADKKEIAKIDVVDSGVGSNVNRGGVRCGLDKTRLLNFSHQICLCRNIDKSIIAFKICQSNRFAAVEPVIAVEVEVNLPVS